MIWMKEKRRKEKRGWCELCNELSWIVRKVAALVLTDDKRRIEG